MPNEVELWMCACDKPADCPIAEAMCQDCWEKHCDKAWWKEVKAVEDQLMTPAQSRVYQAIAELEQELGYAPTLRQIAERAGLRSTSTVHAHLQRLLQAGLIRRASRTVGYTTRGKAS